MNVLVWKSNQRPGS